MKKRTKKLAYEVVGGPLDGKKVSANAAYESHSEKYMKAPYWNICSGKNVLLCIDGLDDEEIQYAYRLARCGKTSVRYWTFLGENVSDSFIEALGDFSFAVPVLKLNP
jgi:hypothetical protein